MPGREHASIVVERPDLVIGAANQVGVLMHHDLHMERRFCDAIHGAGVPVREVLDGV